LKFKQNKSEGESMFKLEASGQRINKLGVKLKSRNHEILSGVGTALGGDDEGMVPHELVLAGLASCTIITCQMYANRKQWPLQSTEVKVVISAENSEGTTIERDIRFLGDLSEEQKKRLLEIANKCAVHRFLTGHISINTKLI
jgi:putative redox protein